MIFFLSYRSIGELFTSDRFVWAILLLWSGMIRMHYRDVIDTIGTITYLLSMFVYSDNIQVIICFCIMYSRNGRPRNHSMYLLHATH